MKKILPFLMILMVLFAFIACDNGNGGSSGGNPADYVGTWTGTMGDETVPITLNADGTMSGYSPIMEPTNIDGFWTVTNDGVIIGADVGDVDPEEGIIPGSLQGDKLVINLNGQIELTK